MKKMLFVLALGLIVLSSCKKEEPVVDKEYYKIPDTWLLKINDSFHPNHNLDTLYFDQARGIYSLKWKSTPLNYLELDLKAIPLSNDTFYYTKTYVSAIKGGYRGIPFTGDITSEDTLFSLVLLNGIMTINSDTLYTNYSGSQMMLRINQLKMTDSIP